MDTKEVPIKKKCLCLSKSFDTIDHIILLAKLRYYVMRDTALLLKSYLNNPKQYYSVIKIISYLFSSNYIRSYIVLGLCYLSYICRHINDLSQASSIFKVMVICR